MRCLGLVLILVLAGCGPSTPSRDLESATGSAHDVPTYRGDSARTGQMPGPGPSGKPGIAWQFQAGDAIDSSPIVVGGLVIVASTDGVVHGIELASGTEQWKVTLPSPVHATPLFAAGNVLVADEAGVVHALDPTTGAPRWTRETDGEIAGSPAASGSTVIVATGAGSAWAIDITNGTTRWHVTVPGAARRSVAVDRDQAYVGVTPGQLIALRISDGSFAWRATLVTDGDVGTPTATDGLVFAAVGLDTGDAGQRGVVALDRSTGEERWRYASSAEQQIYAPAVVGDRAFVIGDDRQLVRLATGDGAVTLTTALDARAEALPAIADGVVYVATNGGALLALDAEDGHERWRAPITGVPFAPVVTGGFVLVPTSVGLLVAIGAGD